MPQVEIRLRRMASAAGKAEAWYLPGDKPKEWLREISFWPVDHTAVRIVVICQEDGVQIAGALAIPPSADFSASGYSVPFRRLCENVYLPVDAELSPYISKRETAEIFTQDYTYAWIPGRGLTATEPSQLLALSELVVMPLPLQNNWDSAVPGIAFSNRIAAIFPEQDFSADDVIAEGRDDIGDRAAEITKLPKAPKEPMSGIGGMAGRAVIVGMALPLMGLAKLGTAIGGMLPNAGSRSGIPSQSVGGGESYGKIPRLTAITEMANQLMRGVSKAIEEIRHKEVGRLLNMLDSDPDQGLKFAIPFGGNAHRGLSSPGAFLGRRNVNFSLNRMGGGGAADVWNMSSEYQQKLLAKYRELAAREARLGRHRRAAYIYAELLGDMGSAASTLEQGGHFREAAVLYRDRLKNVQAAAECLERGMLWNEAIELYRTLEKHKKVGDLLTQIEQYESAAEAYHDAAKELLKQSDLLSASRIYEEKLRDVSLALETLDAGWPNSLQAKLCVNAGLAMRARLGDHDSASQQIQSLFFDAERLDRHAEVAELLAEAYEQYPENTVCDEAAKFSRQIIVEHVKMASRSDSERFIKTLNRLAPNDRLLQRDGRRFVEEHFAKRAALAPVQRFLSSRKPSKLQLVNQFDLLLNGVWRCAATISDTIYVAGVIDKGIVFARCDQEGQVKKNLVPWPKTPLASDVQLQVFAQHSPLNIFAIGEKPLEKTQIFSVSDERGMPYSVSAGTPKGHGVVWGAAIGSQGQTWAVENRADPALVCVGLTGTLISSQSLLGASDAPWNDAVTPLPMHATSNHVLLGVGCHLLCVKDGQVKELERFPSRITSLSGGQPYAASVVTISLEEGAVLWRYGYEKDARPFAMDMLAPLTLLNQGGFAVAADENHVEVYESSDRKLRRVQLNLRSEIEHQSGQPIALLPTRQTDHVALVTSSGKISIYEI